MSVPIAEASVRVHAILEPYTTEERQRIVRAVMALLGDDVARHAPSTPPAGGSDGEFGYSAAADAWIKKHGVGVERLHTLFHFANGKAECIGLPRPDLSNKENTVNAYLLQGVAALLGTGDTAFTDDAARRLCNHLGCYDSSNHSKAIKKFGSHITGSPTAGWKLTVPGLAAAAALVKS